LAYQPLANSTFLSQQTSRQQPTNRTLLSEQTSTSHQPTEIIVGGIFFKKNKLQAKVRFMTTKSVMFPHVLQLTLSLSLSLSLRL
jgi:hypothetical protein